LLSLLFVQRCRRCFDRRAAASPHRCAFPPPPTTHSHTQIVTDMKTLPFLCLIHRDGASSHARQVATGEGNGTPTRSVTGTHPLSSH
jgi:hypothetical protein